MKILVLGEHHGGKVKDSTLATLTPASRLEGSRTPRVVRRGAVSTP